MWFLYTSGYRAINWKIVDLPWIILLKKIDSPSHRSHQLFIVPQLVMETHESLPTPCRKLTGLILCTSCSGNHNCSWVYKYSTQHIFTPIFSNLLHSLCPLLHGGPWALEKWCNIDVQFVVEHSIVTYSPYLDQLWGFC